MWFDGEWENTWTHERGVDLYNYVRKLDPTIIVNNRVDKGREGMASTFLVRLKVGPVLVDAKGVNRLYQSRVRKGDLAFLVGAALFAMLVVVAVAQPLHVFVRVAWLSLRETWHTLSGH